MQVSVDLHQLDQRGTVVAQRTEEAVHREVPSPLPRARHLESMLPDGAFELAALPQELLGRLAGRAGLRQAPMVRAQGRQVRRRAFSAGHP